MWTLQPVNLGIEAQYMRTGVDDKLDVVAELGGKVDQAGTVTSLGIIGGRVFWSDSGFSAFLNLSGGVYSSGTRVEIRETRVSNPGEFDELDTTQRPGLLSPSASRNRLICPIESRGARGLPYQHGPDRCSERIAMAQETPGKAKRKTVGVVRLLIYLGSAIGCGSDASPSGSPDQAMAPELESQIRVTTPAATQHEMVLIPAGEFDMGDTSGFHNERPVHSVYLHDFYIDTFEATAAKYLAFLNAAGGNPLWSVNYLQIERTADGFELKSEQEAEQPVLYVTGLGQLRIACGPDCACRRKQNGKRRHAAQTAERIHGATTSIPRRLASLRMVASVKSEPIPLVRLPTGCTT